MSDELMVICEGSGCGAHMLPSIMGLGICAMCGHTVELNGSVALLHTREDILAMVERGDFDA
jgi:hypothetical protein